MSSSNNTQFVSKAGVYCLLIVLFCSIIFPGITSADDSIDTADLSYSYSYIGLSRASQENQEFIYISGSNVTAIFNYLLNFSVDTGSKMAFGEEIEFSENGNTYSFDTSKTAGDAHSFSLRINESLRYLTFDKYFLSPSSDDDIKTVFYPIYSDRVGVGSSGYYNYDVGFFTSFDEDIFEKMADHELIYRFDNNYLRSVYWFTGFRPETYDYGTVFMPQQMVYSVNLSDSQDVSIGSLFICPEHDPDSDMYGNSGGAEKGSCAEDLKWVLFINGEPREAADYLNIITNNAEGSDPASPGTPGNQGTPGNPGNSGNTGNSGSDVNTGFQHIVTFTDLSLLYDDLMESPNVTFMFYPSSSSRDYEEAAVLFVFELEGVHISMSEKGYLLPNGEFHVPVSSNPEPKNPTLSSMAFPEGMSSLLSAATVLIGDLDRGTLKDFDSENLLEDSDVFVHLFVDINFGKSKDSVNQYLSDMGETVSLVFLVPKQINSVAVAKDELKVFHAVETNGQQVLEELKLTIADDPESAYYIVTAETTSFSPFAVVTVLGSGPVSGDDPSGDNGENPNVPVTAGSSSSGTGRSAVILGRTNGSDSSEQNNSVHPNPPIPSLSTVIESLQGHLSMFSILVVLVSGMFMWNYIRRRV